MSALTDYLRAYESPRLARITRNFYAACFPLMKLLPARFMIDRAVATGRLKENGHIVETTSGTFGLALAMLAAARGHRLTLVTASTLIDPGYTRRLQDLGATVVIVEDAEGNGNQQGRLERLRQILCEEPDAYWPNQYGSEENRLAYSRLAELLVRAIGQINCLVGPVGTGGSLFGTAGFLRALFPNIRIVAVDTHRSILFGQPAGKRALRGLGNSILPANVLHEMVDEVHWVGALPAFAATRALYRHHGIFMGPTSGASGLVAGWCARRAPDAAIVAIMPDEGFRYLETVHNQAWLERLDGWPIAEPQEPRVIRQIGPDAETAWTMFAWNRRRLEDVLHAQAGISGQEPSGGGQSPM